MVSAKCFMHILQTCTEGILLNQLCVNVAERWSVNHIVNLCLLTKFEDGL